MNIKRKSFFKNPVLDRAWFENWVAALEAHNGRNYERIEVQTSLGKTHVWGLNTQNENLETLVIFPGARTSSLFWDFDRGLDNLGQKVRIFLVETNGLPNLSAGNTPEIRSRHYGEWAAGLLEQLGIERTYIAGASFGGLLCMKLCIVAPSKIKAAFLLNPGCLQPFSLEFKNLYYNLLPILFPNRKNVASFLNKAVFCKPHHQISSASEQLLLDYELFALTRYKDNTQKPYYMKDELKDVSVDTYLLESDQDILFPYSISVANAMTQIRSLKEITLFPNVGHGIETYFKAIQTIGKRIKRQHVYSII